MCIKHFLYRLGCIFSLICKPYHHLNILNAARFLTWFLFIFFYALQQKKIVKQFVGNNKFTHKQYFFFLQQITKIPKIFGYKLIVHSIYFKIKVVFAVFGFYFTDRLWWPLVGTRMLMNYCAIGKSNKLQIVNNADTMRNGHNQYSWQTLHNWNVGWKQLSMHYANVFNRTLRSDLYVRAYVCCGLCRGTANSKRILVWLEIAFNVK